MKYSTCISVYTQQWKDWSAHHSRQVWDSSTGPFWSLWDPTRWNGNIKQKEKLCWREGYYICQKWVKEFLNWTWPKDLTPVMDCCWKAFPEVIRATGKIVVNTKTSINLTEAVNLWRVYGEWEERRKVEERTGEERRGDLVYPLTVTQGTLLSRWAVMTSAL